jgi:YD repeat-containing protein
MGDDALGVSVDGNGPDLLAFPPGGGWVVTPFNESGQPIESRVYGPNGELIRRLMRSYDAKGRVVESAYVVENLESLREVLRETHAGLRSNPEALEALLTEQLGDHNVFSRISYVYDDQGRVSEEHGDWGHSEKTITKTTYNDHGDTAEEFRTITHPPDSREEFHMRYDYQYDSFGNWTERVMISRSNAGERSRTIHRREITYY